MREFQKRAETVNFENRVQELCGKRAITQHKKKKRKRERNVKRRQAKE
jgi:hypothetical protein